MTTATKEQNLLRALINALGEETWGGAMAKASKLMAKPLPVANPGITVAQLETNIRQAIADVTTLILLCRPEEYDAVPGNLGNSRVGNPGAYYWVSVARYDVPGGLERRVLVSIVPMEFSKNAVLALDMAGKLNARQLVELLNALTEYLWRYYVPFGGAAGV